MAADVVFTAASPWYTNSYSWHAIMRHALGELDEPARGEYEGYVNALGVDFAFLPDAKAVEVARWLSGVVGRMLAEGEIGTSEADRAHAEELLRKLHSEMQVRDETMSRTPLSERRARLLTVVAEGGGNRDARQIDLTTNARYGPGTGTVLRELEELQQLGLVVRDDSRSGVGGRWKVTAAARPYLEGSV